MSEPTIDARLIVDWMGRAARALENDVTLLTELDSARGDADHGVNMVRGFAAIADALRQEQFRSAGTALRQASAVLRRTVGGTSGALWSAALHRAGKTLGATDPVSAALLAESLEAAATAVFELGGAKEGDGTMLDALLPGVRILKERLSSGDTTERALAAASEVARARAQATATLVATKGRASYLGERSAGKPDPGAVSAAIILTALHSAVLNSDLPSDAPTFDRSSDSTRKGSE